MSKTIIVTIVEETEEKTTAHEGCFIGDELTSPECQAIIWLREQQKDALDHD